MKKVVLILSIIVLIIFMAACGNSGQPSITSPGDMSDSEESNAAKTLIISSNQTPTGKVFDLSVDEFTNKLMQTENGSMLGKIQWTQDSQYSFEGEQQYLKSLDMGNVGYDKFAIGLVTDENRNIFTAYTAIVIYQNEEVQDGLINVAKLIAANCMQILQITNSEEEGWGILTSASDEYFSALDSGKDFIPSMTNGASIYLSDFGDGNQLIIYYKITAGQQATIKNSIDSTSDTGDYSPGSLEDDFDYYYANYPDYVEGYIDGIEGYELSPSGASNSEYRRGWTD